MSQQPTILNSFNTSGSRTIPLQQNQIRPHPAGMAGARLAAVLALLCGLLLLAACGPERRGTASEEELTAESIRIAQEYEQNGDLSRARVQLQALDAANPTQFLIYLAENRAATAPGAPETTALVRLALAMGLQSRPVLDYAIANNLVAGHPAANNPAGEAVQGEPAPVAAPQTGQAAGAASGEAGTETAIVTETGAGTETAEMPSLPTATPRADGAAAPAGDGQPVAAAPAAEAAVSSTVAAAISKPMAQASNAMNVREGPGTAYPVVGAMNAGDQAEILAKSPQADWWQVLLPSGAQGWVYGPLVQTVGDTSAVAVAANIPAPPPTPTPAPVVEAPPAQAPAAAQPPAEQAPAEQAPTEQPAPPPSDKPHFALVAKRLWSKAENGDCRGQHLLRIHVLDANGNRLNGVTLQGLYTGEILVT
ncbi:MAG TPA: SH3 domain-containing protein, partial [Caldilineaceae bacterium]|nr:SH3 domain-containing protein [Caldilineaceae bacterium]